MIRDNRILKHQEFNEIIRNTPTQRSKSYVIHFRDNSQGKPRIGICVSKKNGNAVTRNRIKRQIRAMFCDVMDLCKSLDLIIIVRTTYDPTSFQSNKTELVSSLAKIGEKH
ncbi:MAG: ribonuclease P protein component [Bacilli bacterium]|nr:ribonuclease P protein component [Bacilli bacterium]